MRYRLTGPGSWDIAFQRTNRGNAGDMPIRIGMGRYLSPGEVSYDGSYDGSTGATRFRGFGQTTDSTGTTDSSTSSTPGWLQNLVTGVTQFAVGRQQLQTVDEINQINIQRAAIGLPPINPQISQPGINVGLSPDVQNLLLYGGLGLAALWVFSTVMKR